MVGIGLCQGGDGALALNELLREFMQEYSQARMGAPFKGHPLHQTLRQIEAAISDLSPVQAYSTLKVRGSVGQGNWATIPWIALLDTRLTNSVQQGVYIAYLFASDMSRVYLTLNQGVTDLSQREGQKHARQLLRQQADAIRQRSKVRDLPGFVLNWDLDLGVSTGTASLYTDSTIAYKEYQRQALPGDLVLEQDLAAVLAAYKDYADQQVSSGAPPPGGQPSPSPKVTPPQPGRGPDQVGLAALVERLYEGARSEGFFYPREDYIAFCIALKTKPFVILAGISGTGKTRLVEIVARQLGVEDYTIAVRPDWSDSSDLLGYFDLKGEFRPGPLLKILEQANHNLDQPFFVCLDEMNLARVEHYLPEFLSVFEKRHRGGGRIITPPISPSAPQPWGQVYFSDNVFVVGTVNMDETTYPFSRKVLDRANTMEFNYIDLNYLPPANQAPQVHPADWAELKPTFCRLPEFYSQDPKLFDQVIGVLQELNTLLEPGGFQVGYRVRDEVCLFVLHGREAGMELETCLDFQVRQKILPRIQGGSSAIRSVLTSIWNWATGQHLSADDPELAEKVTAVAGDHDFLYPRTAAKLVTMIRRLEEEGFTSFWV